MSDSPTTVVRACYEAINVRDLDAFDRLYAREVTLNGEPASPAEVKAYCGAYVDAFNDLELTIERLVENGEWVAARVVARGTHTGKLDTLEPTHRQMEVAQHDLTRVADGRIVEVWNLFDQFGMLQQLGTMPQTEESAS